MTLWRKLNLRKYRARRHHNHHNGVEKPILLQFSLFKVSFFLVFVEILNWRPIRDFNELHRTKKKKKNTPALYRDCVCMCVGVCCVCVWVCVSVCVRVNVYVLCVCRCSDQGRCPDPCSSQCSNQCTDVQSSAQMLKSVCGCVSVSVSASVCVCVGVWVLGVCALCPFVCVCVV